MIWLALKILWGKVKKENWSAFFFLLMMWRASLWCLESPVLSFATGFSVPGCVQPGADTTYWQTAKTHAFPDKSSDWRTQNIRVVLLDSLAENKTSLYCKHAGKSHCLKNGTVRKLRSGWKHRGYVKLERLVSVKMHSLQHFVINISMYWTKISVLYCQL